MSNSQNDILHMKCSAFTCVFTILVKFDIYFLALPWEIIYGAILQVINNIISTALEKCKKQCDIV